MKLHGLSGFAGDEVAVMKPMKGRTVIPAREARAVQVAAGQRVRVVDLEGGQVGDLFAFSSKDPAEALSAAHTRSVTSRLFPWPGEAFVTDRRRPILTLAADTSPGLHDMLIAACSPARYRELGAPEHPSCARNLDTALAELGLAVAVTPQPVNVFMHIPVTESGELGWLPAKSRAGDAITFEASMDCLVVVSACPQDLVDINSGNPTALAIDVL
jgi:uncharacterized protein YcgI (DUF1989 family)